MIPFNPFDQATWPYVMEAQHIAQIYHRTILGLKKSCQQNRFVPAPYRRRPYLWRRAEILRDIEGTRLLRRVG